jgi:hypothetical protein
MTWLSLPVSTIAASALLLAGVASAERYCYRAEVGGAVRSDCYPDVETCEREAVRGRTAPHITPGSITACVAPPVLYCYRAAGTGLDAPECFVNQAECRVSRAREVEGETMAFIPCTHVDNRPPRRRIAFVCTLSGYYNLGGRVRPIIFAPCEIADLDERVPPLATIVQPFAWCAGLECFSNQLSCRTEANGDPCHRLTPSQWERAAAAASLGLGWL